MTILVRRRNTPAEEMAELRARLDAAEERLRAVEHVCFEEAALGEFFASVDDDVRAAAHLLAAAHLRTALRQNAA